MKDKGIIAKSRVKVKKIAGAVYKSAGRKGTMIYFGIWVDGEKSDHREVAVKRMWDPDENQYLYFLDRARFWSQKMVADMIKCKVCNREIEV